MKIFSFIYGIFFLQFATDKQIDYTYRIYVLRSLKPKQYLTLGVYNLNTFRMWHDDTKFVKEPHNCTSTIPIHNIILYIYHIMMPCKVCDLRNAFRPLIYIHGVGCSVKPARAGRWTFSSGLGVKKKKRRIINKTFPHLKRKTLTARRSRYKMSGNSLDQNHRRHHHRWVLKAVADGKPIHKFTCDVSPISYYNFAVYYIIHMCNAYTYHIHIVAHSGA